MTREIPMKQWIIEESMKWHRSPRNIWRWLKRGHYPDVKLRRVNKRVVFVIQDKHATEMAERPS